MRHLRALPDDILRRVHRQSCDFDWVQRAAEHHRVARPQTAIAIASGHDHPVAITRGFLLLRLPDAGPRARGCVRAGRYPEPSEVAEVDSMIEYIPALDLRYGCWTPESGRRPN